MAEILLGLTVMRTIPWLIKWCCIAFTAFFLAVIFTPISNRLASSLVVESAPKKADLIAVLGGGAYRNKVLGGASTERLLRGLILYRQGYAPRVIFSGGSILELSRKVAHTVTKSKDLGSIAVVEAALMMDVTEKLGFDVKDFHVDASSTDTYENFLRIKGYMEETGLKSCLIVTSATHMRRAYLISKKLSLECHPAPVEDYSKYRTGAADRLALLREVWWEYSALALYRLYGYI